MENEAEVFGAVVQWARAQTPRADPSTARPLFAAVRYTLLESVFCTEVVMKEPLLDDKEGREVFLAWFQLSLEGLPVEENHRRWTGALIDGL